MSRPRLILLCSLSILLGSLQAQAFVSFDIQADALSNANGSALAPVTTLVLFVADTTGDGFGNVQSGQSTAVNAVLGGIDDRIVGRYDLTTNNTAGYFGANPTLTLDTVWAENDPLAILWFPTYTISTTTIGSVGDGYGRFSGPALDGSNAWITPADGSSNYKLYFFNAAGTIQAGSNAATLGNASFTVAAVPEPGRALLLLLGSALSLLRRHRKL